MDAQQLDVIVRISGVAALLFLAAMLIRDGQGRLPARLFAPLAVCICAFLIGDTPDPSLRLAGFAGSVAHLLSGYAAVLIWWFCLACFDRDFRLKGPVLAVGLVWIAVASADRGLFGPLLADKGLSWLLVAFGFGMVGHLAWRLLRDRAGDLVEARREARVLVVVLLGGLLFVDLSVDVLLGMDWRPRWFAISENGAILAFTLWLSARLLRGDTAALTFEQPRLAPTSSPVGMVAAGPAEARLRERLRELVEIERVHLDPGLSFAVFVSKMGASERTVRQLINHELGHDHFRSFLNAWRMEEARRLLADPGRAQDKLIAIAQDSGFSSLASFNRVFRASEACAPSQYRQARLTVSSDQQNPSFEEPSAAF